MSEKRPAPFPRDAKTADPSLQIERLEAELQSAQETIAALQESNGLLNALVVDDDAACRATLAEQLRVLGYTVHTAPGGAEAVARYAEDPVAVDLVMLDVLMPEMDGLATFKELIRIDPEVKVVLCSGYSLEGQVSEILDLGARDFIQKPFELSDLQRVLHKALAGD